MFTSLSHPQERLFLLLRHADLARNPRCSASTSLSHLVPGGLSLSRRFCLGQGGLAGRREAAWEQAGLGLGEVGWAWRQGCMTRR